MLQVHRNDNGRWIEKVDHVNGTTVRYYYDNNHRVLAEYDGADDAQRYFVYGDSIDEALLMHSNVNIGGNSTMGDYYYAHDHLYSVRALLDGTGHVQERYLCPAYGYPDVWLFGDFDHDGDVDWAEHIASCGTVPFSARCVRSIRLMPFSAGA